MICDAKNADEELLLTSDEFDDFRDYTVLPVEDPFCAGEAKIDLDESFILLREALNYSEDQEKLPTVDRLKIRLKLINEQFDEAALGFTKGGEECLEEYRTGFLLDSSPQKLYHL